MVMKQTNKNTACIKLPGKTMQYEALFAIPIKNGMGEVFFLIHLGFPLTGDEWFNIELHDINYQWAEPSTFASTLRFKWYFQKKKLTRLVTERTRGITLIDFHSHGAHDYKQNNLINSNKYLIRELIFSKSSTPDDQFHIKRFDNHKL